jgi:hypothetical protein
MEINLTFIELVELHERKWGIQLYPGRPTLAQLMSAPLVVLWTVKGRFILTVHNTPHDLNEFVYQVITGGIQDMPERKLGQVYYEKAPLDLRVRLVNNKPQEPSTPPVKSKQPQKAADDRKEWLPDLPSIPHNGHKLEPLPKPRQHAVEHGDHVKINLPPERSTRPGRHIAESESQGFRLYVIPEDHKAPVKPAPRPGETEEQFQERLYREKIERLNRMPRPESK